MTVMSALLGFVVTQFVPREYTYYACTAIMFLFGLKMLWEAWRMSPDEGAETQREVEEELARYTVVLHGGNGLVNREGAALIKNKIKFS
jgi:putative Ca2+/H+ antiporter (TMEM165/GDT1 family)